MNSDKYLLDSKSLISAFNELPFDIDFSKNDIYCVDNEEAFRLNKNIKNISSKNFDRIINNKKFQFLKEQELNEINVCLNLNDFVYVVFDKNNKKIVNDLDGIKVISYDEFKKKF